jgi:hypothetical protein
MKYTLAVLNCIVNLDPIDVSRIFRPNLSLDFSG